MAKGILKKNTSNPKSDAQFHQRSVIFGDCVLILYSVCLLSPYWITVTFAVIHEDLVLCDLFMIHF